MLFAASCGGVCVFVLATGWGFEGFISWFPCVSSTKTSHGRDSRQSRIEAC